MWGTLKKVFVFKSVRVPQLMPKAGLEKEPPKYVQRCSDSQLGASGLIFGSPLGSPFGGQFRQNEELGLHALTIRVPRLPTDGSKMAHYGFQIARDPKIKSK